METGLRFLIVDDDEHAGSKLGRLVEKVWFPKSSVVLAASEAAARTAISGADGREAPAFDLVILDMQLRFDDDGGPHPDGLPEREAGLRLLTEIRGSSLGGTPVVLWSVLGGQNPVVGGLKVDFVPNVNDRAPLYSSMRSMLAAENHRLPPIPGSLDSRRKAIEANVLRMAALIGALTLLVGLLTGAAGSLWNKVFSGSSTATYAYIANPPLVAHQYAFPNESSQSSAAALLAPGTQLEVLCRWDTPDELERSWVLLSRGTWLRGSEVLPAATEPADLAELPICDLP